MYSVQNDVDPIEWQARCELAALYRLVAHFRMTDLIDTHITLRIPGGASFSDQPLRRDFRPNESQ